MKTITKPEVKNEIISRIKNLVPESKAGWGKMNAHQAICHLSDQMRDLYGIRPVKYEGNFFMHWVVRPILSRLPKWPGEFFLRLRNTISRRKERPRFLLKRIKKSC